MVYSADYKNVDIPEMPYRCEIELSSACNLRCVYCPRRFFSGISSFMNFELFKKIIDELSSRPETIMVLHRRGESLLHPKFFDCLRYIRGKFTDIQLATNATLLDREKSKDIIETLSFISFSIDLPEEFDRTRVPARYHEVERNILDFLEMNNRKVTTQVSMVSTPQTIEASKERFRRIWSDKVDRVRIYEEHSADGYFGSLRRERGRRVPCSMPFYEILVYEDGKVGRCNHDWNGPPIGDLSKTTIKELWHSASYKELRSQHLAVTFNDPVCFSCDSWYPVAGSQMTGETYESAS